MMRDEIDTDLESIGSMPKLSPRHMAILRRYVAGYRVGDVARLVGCSRRTVSRVIHSDPGRVWLDRLHREAEAALCRRMVARTMMSSVRR